MKDYCLHELSGNYLNILFSSKHFISERSVKLR
nr:MAG TPA: hypothetical protein [Caudoviricetes sp.]